MSEVFIWWSNLLTDSATSTAGQGDDLEAYRAKVLALIEASTERIRNVHSLSALYDAQLTLLANLRDLAIFVPDEPPADRPEGTQG